MPQGFWGSNNWNEFDWSTNIQQGEAAVEFSFTETASLVRIHQISSVIEAEVQSYINPYESGSWNEDNWNQYNWNKGPVFTEAKGLRSNSEIYASLERVTEAACNIEFTLSFYEASSGTFGIECIGDFTLNVALADTSVTDNTSHTLIQVFLANTDSITVRRIIRAETSGELTTENDSTQDHNSYVSIVEASFESYVTGNGDISIFTNQESFLLLDSNNYPSGSYSVNSISTLDFVEENDPGGNFQCNAFEQLPFSGEGTVLNATMQTPLTSIEVTLESPQSSGIRVAVVNALASMETLTEGEILLIQNLLSEITSTVEEYARGRRITGPMQIDYFQIKQTAIQEILSKLKKTTLTGTVDGVNDVFTTSANYLTVLDVQVDGVSVDFTETDVNEVTLGSPPASMSVVKALWIEE